MTMTYGYYYGTPMMTYINYGVVLGIAVFAALILGVVLFFAFFRRKNEGKFHGWKGKLYHFMNFNRFYAEDILRFIYIVCTSLFTIVGIVTIILGAFITGILELVVANVILRILFELIMMFIIMCRKSVSIDKRLSKIADFYEDSYGEDWGEGCCSCDGACEDVESGCDACAHVDTDEYTEDADTETERREDSVF